METIILSPVYKKQHSLPEVFKTMNSIPFKKGRFLKNLEMYKRIRNTTRSFWIVATYQA